MIHPAKGLRFCIYTQMCVEGMWGSPGSLEGFLYSCSGGSKFCFFPESTIWESAVRSVCVLSPRGVKEEEEGRKWRTQLPVVFLLSQMSGPCWCYLEMLGGRGAGRVQAAALSVIVGEAAGYGGKTRTTCIRLDPSSSPDTAAWSLQPQPSDLVSSFSFSRCTEVRVPTFGNLMCKTEMMSRDHVLRRVLAILGHLITFFRAFFSITSLEMPWASAARGTGQVVVNDSSYLWISKSTT